MRFPILALIFLLLASPALAQEGKPDVGLKPRPRKDPKDKPEFGERPPEKEKPSKPDAEEKPADPIDALLARMRAWPRADAQQAMNELALVKEKARPRVRELLADDKRETRCAAAEWLGRHGEKKDAEAIATAALDGRVGSRAIVFLESVAHLDEPASIDCALEMIGRGARSMKESAALFLRSRADEVDRARVDALLASHSKTTRLFAFDVLAEGFGPEAARETAFRLLDDTSAELCRRAAIMLASDEESRPRLAEIAKPFDSRRAHYAMLGLVLRGIAEGRQPLDAATIERLLGPAGLSSLDDLPRSVAAIGLGNAGFLERHDAVDAVLDSRIVPTLLDSMGGTRYFPDIPAVRGPSIQVLESLTGMRFGLSVHKWRDWWVENRIGFRARRLLREVRGDDYDGLRLEIEMPDRPAVRLSTRPHDLLGGALILDRGRAESLVARLTKLGYFTDAWGPTRRKGDVAVFAEVAGRERLRATPVARLAKTEAAELRRALGELEADLDWQRYWDRREFARPESFIAARAPWFAPGVSPERRAASLKIVIAEALDDLPPEARLGALRRMASIEGAPPLDFRLSAQLVRLIDASKGFGPFEIEAAELLVRERVPEVRDALVGALAKAGGNDGPRILADALAAYGPESVASAMTDARAPVRRAAARALATSHADDATVRLESLLLDESRAVRVQALVSLGQREASSAHERIERLARDSDDLDVRCAALRALGAVAKADAVTTLVDALRDDSLLVRVAAVQGLEATHASEALGPLFFALEHDEHGAVRTIAGRSIVAFGGDEARTGLTRLAGNESAETNARVAAVKSLERLEARDDLAALLDSPVPAVAIEAASALGSLRDGRAVPYLLDSLREGRSVSRALTALEGISARTFGSRPAAEQALLFLGWWEEHRGGTPRDWLASALRDRGYRIESLAGDRMDPDTLRVLIIALRDDSWAIRHAASRELAARVDEGLGAPTSETIGKFDAREEAERVAELWRRWWESRYAERSEGGSKGEGSPESDGSREGDSDR